MESIDNPVPKEFKEGLRHHFGEDVMRHVVDELDKPASTAVRLNANKPSGRFEQEEKVAWSVNGRIVKERPVFALDPLFHAGAYYVQDASSMVLELLMDTLGTELSEPLMLDLCAAPGGKSIIMADAFSNGGFLVANEMDRQRVSILQENLLKWGLSNTMVTSLSTESFAQSGIEFDLVVVDAPCSGEGMFRKDMFARKQWSPQLVRHCAIVQHRILEHADGCLRTGGFLIYSTCTMNREENEDQIRHLLSNGYERHPMQLDIYSEKLIPAVIDGSVIGYYLLPGISQGEGLFISVLRKNKDKGTPKGKFKSKRPDAFDSSLLETYRAPYSFSHMVMQENMVSGFLASEKNVSKLTWDLHLRSVGLSVLEVKGKDRIPLHGLAMHPASKPEIQLNLEEALEYLRRNSVRVKDGQRHGWQMVGYENHVLGWVKTMPQRVNNYYPSSLRLRMQKNG